MLSCELCKIFKNTFFYRTPLVIASVLWLQHTADIDFLNWKLDKILIQKGYGGAVLIDLPEDSDALIFDFLLAKLHTYGFDST